ncbi:hypothetical protein [Sphingobium sp. EM0848]|uniref:hypothetical protein n=1 Tax=Sphingobium sp. EM0848 TaxID=2743473 RepID=UPI00159BF849|nr:hypothetical protein [Sphingobium sp. EM0848]
MQCAFKASLVGLMALGTLVTVPVAWAGCGDIPGKQPASWNEGSNAHMLERVDYGAASIVGMWAVKFTAGGNQVDFGYAQWHSDGTELMNSGGRAPATQNFCMGVWQQTGPRRYHLNHFALSYDVSGALNAKVNIKEDVTVDPNGATYSGPFTIDVYEPNTGALLQHLAGQVTGQRVAAY